MVYSTTVSLPFFCSSHPVTPRGKRCVGTLRRLRDCETAVTVDSKHCSQKYFPSHQLYLLQSYFHNKQTTPWPAQLSSSRCFSLVSLADIIYRRICSISGSEACFSVGLDLDSGQILATACFGGKSTRHAFDRCEAPLKDDRH